MRVFIFVMSKESDEIVGSILTMREKKFIFV